MITTAMRTVIARPWVLAVLNAAGLIVNIYVVKALGNLLYTDANPEGIPETANHCGQVLGLSFWQAGALQVVIATAATAAVLAVAWCRHRRRNGVGWPWVVMTGAAPVLFAAFNVMAAVTVLTTTPVRMAFGCGG